MRQNIDTSPINEMKNTITECIYGNTIAKMNSTFNIWIPLGLFFLFHKAN